MLAVDIALGVAGGLVLFGGAKGLLELPGEIAERRRQDRHHREFMDHMDNMIGKAMEAYKADQKKPVRRKPAVKKTTVRKFEKKVGAVKKSRKGGKK